jgi:hypothetical protein
MSLWCDHVMQDAHLATFGYNFIGALGNINIWNPKVERPEDFTTAQIWLKAANGLEIETIEAGWAVSDHPPSKSRSTIHTYFSS